MRAQAIPAGRGWIASHRHAALVGLATLAFIALSIWWLLYDQRLPGGGDPARHIATATLFKERFRDLDLLEPLTLRPTWDFSYPPLARVVGALPGLVGLKIHDWGPIALNVVFVPLLAAGCYLTGRRTFGPVAGLLAALFALGSPMVLQLFHVFLLDAPLAAAVAITVWALLASERFSRTRESILAGGLLGIALLIKTPAPLFVGGVIVVMLCGGGWRQWRNVALMGLTAIVISAPYYLPNLGDYLKLSAEAAAGSDDPWTRLHGWTFEGLHRFSPESFAWYGWAAVNLQYLFPLTVLFAVGLVSAISQVRTRPHVPEVLGGLVGGYLAMTLLTVHDPRYTLPLVVYASVIATGWIVSARRKWVRAGATGLLLVAVTMNVAAVTVGNLGSIRVNLPGFQSDAPEDVYAPEHMIQPGNLTLIDERGYVTAEPRPNPLWDRLLTAARRTGIETAGIAVRQQATWGIDGLGFDVAANEYGIRSGWFDPSETPSPDLRVNVWFAEDAYWTEELGLPEPCAQLEEGTMVPGTDGVSLRVVVERRAANGYRRWCDF